VLGRVGIRNKAGRRPFLVGLTGNFGTGKSTVARLFRRLGAEVVNADRLAHEVFRKENRLYPGIRSLFPELKGRLSREALARIVFQSPVRRRALESLVHPYVFDRIREETRRRRARVVVVEAPLLFESGFDQACDGTILVQASPQETLRRLRGKGFREAEVRARWRAQWPVKKKIRRSDYLIDNSDGRQKTQRQVVQIWKDIERSLKKHGKREG